MKRPTSLVRLVVVIVVGVVVTSGVAVVAPWQFALLAGWVAAAVAFSVWIWATVGRFAAEETRAYATSEDTGRVTTSLILLGASVVSLLGTGLALVKAGDATPGGHFVLSTFAVLTVAASWTVVHTVFALRYAHEYYGDPEGGIDFKNPELPDYRDFAYVAFTIGMTFQVSDTDVQAPRIRRTVLRHALLA